MENNVICKADIRVSKVSPVVIIITVVVGLVVSRLLGFNIIGDVMGFVLICGIVALILLAIADKIKKCIIELTAQGITGRNMKVQQLNLPMDQISSVMIASDMFSTIFGGQTVSVSTSSGKIQFPCVQNATEFVNATLAQIETYKNGKTAAALSAPAAVPAAANASAAEKLTDLKKLYDNGVLTQEEFERKKQQLLDQM